VTKLGVIAVAAVAVAVGTRLVASERGIAAFQPGDDIVSRGRPESKSRPLEAKSVLEQWTSTYGVAVTARRFVASDLNQSTQVAARLLDVTRAIALNPTSANLWLVYADLCWQMHLPIDRVWAALDMAQLTGRREADVMVFNALQTIRLWETASDLRKARALSAISEQRWQLLVERRETLAGALSSKSEATRKEIGAALIERLGPDKSWLKNVGL
jgi:hypothetical protein